MTNVFLNLHIFELMGNLIESSRVNTINCTRIHRAIVEHTVFYLSIYLFKNEMKNKQKKYA